MNFFFLSLCLSGTIACANDRTETESTNKNIPDSTAGKKKNSSGLRCLEIETLEPVPVLGLMGISLKWQKRSRGSPRRDNCLATQVFWRGFYVPDKWGLPKIPPARLIFPGQVGSRSRLDSRGIAHAVPGSALGIWAISLESTERFHPDLCSFGSVQDPSSLDLVVW